MPAAANVRVTGVASALDLLPTPSTKTSGWSANVSPAAGSIATEPPGAIRTTGDEYEQHWKVIVGAVAAAGTARAATIAVTVAASASRRAIYLTWASDSDFVTLPDAALTTSDSFSE